MQGALGPLQGLGTRPHGTLGELRLDDAGEVLEIIVARVAEVSGPKAEIDRHRTAVTTLVLQEIIAVFRTHLIILQHSIWNDYVALQPHPL